MPSNPSVSIGAGAKATPRSKAIAPGLFAALLGILMIWGVGFSHAEAVHNAAHDTRHSNAFPCH